MAKLDRPAGLHARGGRLWDEISEAHDLDPVQRVTLEECCRSADRLDELDSVIQGNGVLELMRFRLRELDDEQSVTISFDNALGEARQQQTVFKQLLVSLRLPDEAGKKPQQRGARGAYAPSADKAGKVSSLDRARERKSG